MRGQWDNEQPLSPSLVRSAAGLLSALLVLWGLVSIGLSVLALMDGRYGPAAIQLISGFAVPFAIWLASRVLIDILIVHHRTLDHMQAISQAPVLDTTPPQG